MLRNELKINDNTKNNSALQIDFGGEKILFDPAGILIIERVNALVVSDLHLEKGSSFARNRQFLPPYDTVATLKQLKVLVEKYRPDIVVSLGDSFHDDYASKRLDSYALETINYIAKSRQLIWVTGNHDPSAPEHLPGECVNDITYAGIVLRHIPEPNLKGFEISGHLHPCAKIHVRSKTVRRACFVCDRKRLIMPSFGVMTGGLHLGHKAFEGLLKRETLHAYALGRDQIYPISPQNIAHF